MKITTLLFLLRETEILLAMKKRGTGEGKWNGVGGKVGPNETLEAAAIRECQEEIGVTPKKLERVSYLDFQIPSKDFHNVTHVYLCREWEGEPVESEEMAPRWFSYDAIPYSEMWPDDAYWLPRVLAGERLEGSFLFDDQERIIKHRLDDLSFDESRKTDPLPYRDPDYQG